MPDPDRVITFDISENQKFKAFIKAVYAQHKPKNTNVLNETVLALDPGETTGVAEFDGDNKIRVYQKVTKDLGLSYEWLEAKLERFDGLLPNPQFNHLRYEDYRVYAWKAEDHAWSPVHTIQWIGAIKVAAHVTQTPNSCLMAANVKKFWTDDKLNMFDLNPKGLKHGRDALRHLLYYLCFPV